MAAGPASISVHEAEPGEFEAVAGVLARVFYADAAWAWMLPNASTRMRTLTRTFTAAARFSAAAGPGGVWITDDLAGAAIWSPPGRPRDVPMGPFLQMLFGMGWGIIRQVRAEIALSTIRERHWFLGSLGVEAAQRRRGVGAALIAPVLERCDRDRLPAYLNTQDPANLSFYRSHGFEVFREVDVSGGGPHLYEMRRRPA